MLDRHAGLMLLWMVALSGCASWHAPESHHEWKLPAPNAGEDAVVFEFAFVRWPEAPPNTVSSSGETSTLWHVLDEQFLAPEMREQLAANGLRIGIISDPLPEAIRTSLEATRDPLSVISQQHATAGAEILTRRERRQCPSGSHEEIEVLPMEKGKRVVLVQEAGHVRADAFDQPRGFVRLTARGLGDGRVRVELVPSIDFGEPLQRIIGGQGAYRYDTRRKEQAFESLAVATALAKGQTLVVTSSQETKGLGGAFFADRFESAPDRLLLLIRIAESHQDELFSPATRQESLVTPLD